MAGNLCLRGADAGLTPSAPGGPRRDPEGPVPGNTLVRPLTSQARKPGPDGDLGHQAGDLGHQAGTAAQGPALLAPSPARNSPEAAFTSR